VSEILVLVLVIAVVGGLFWLILKPSRAKRTPAGSRPRKDPSRLLELQQMRESRQFWAVTIEQAGCSQSRALAGKRFTLESAPKLPLEGCNAVQCTCTYKGLEERRTKQIPVAHDYRKTRQADEEQGGRSA